MSMPETEAFPYFPSRVYHTAAGTPYLKESGLALISKPQYCINEDDFIFDDSVDGLDDFAGGFGADLDLGAFINDGLPLSDADNLCKFAGQLCYLSLDGKRTHNKDASRYFEHIKAQGHGSILEHANFSFLVWGIDRSVTHELVRHRSGFAYSQVSQRYVDGKKLRFVERPEFQEERVWPMIDSQLGGGDSAALANVMSEIHDGFETRIDNAVLNYNNTVELLEHAREHGHPMLQGDARTDLRKKLNQTARESLPNCTEAPIVFTANARALRHMINMRASSAADVQIRDMAVKALKIAQVVAPLIFEDFTINGDCAETKYPKV